VGGLIAESQLRVLAAAAALSLLLLALAYPRVLFWTLLVVVVVFRETEYGFTASSSFTLSEIVLPGTTIGLLELMTYALTAIVAARCLLGNPVTRLPRSVEAVLLLLAAYIVLHVVAAVLWGWPFSSALHPWGGSYTLAGLAALWCFSQLLSEPSSRLRLLDVLFAVAAARASVALAGYFLGSGDVANAYQSVGVAKVAIWESANHLLYTFLI
jgi:hypothetical protein